MIGQSQVTEPLMTALRTDRVNHAYLFSGPRGCGKTTSARILARCLNCAEGPTDTPCGTCPSCVELSRGGGGSLDVVEIDAASHNGVDDARDLRERAVFAPARDRYKIFILDEAHMVTPQGFNALLKLVEEPPEHVKFIFATTEPDKVLGTIRSRTHHYPFRLVPPAPMLEYVQQLCDEEHIEVQPGVLALVVRAGGGSPRDTLSLLDQLMAGSEGSTIDYERAVALLGYTHGALLDEVVDAIGAGDAAGAFAAADRVVQTGQDPRRFVEDLLERLRDLIVVAASSPEAAAAVLRGVPEDELARMAAQAKAFGQAELSRVADLVNQTLTEMTGATSPRLHLELMLARVLVPSSDETERGALARVERLERRVGVDGSLPGAGAGGTDDAGGRSAPAARATPARAEAGRGAPEAGAGSARANGAGGAGVPADAAAARDRSATPSGAGAVEWNTADAGAARSGAAERGAAERGAAERGAVQRAGEGAPAESGAPTSAHTGEPSVAEAVTVAEPASGAKPVGPVTLQQVRDAWPEVLAALQRTKRSAWMVAFTAQVRDYRDDDILVLGFPSEQDVAGFRGGAPGQSVSELLRNSIAEVLGVRVKFIARAEGPGHRGSGGDPGDGPGDEPSPEHGSNGSGGASTAPSPAGPVRTGEPEPAREPAPPTAPARAGASAYSAEAAPTHAPVRDSNVTTGRATGPVGEGANAESANAAAPTATGPVDSWATVAIPTDPAANGAGEASAAEARTAPATVTRTATAVAEPPGREAFDDMPNDADAPPEDIEPPFDPGPEPAPEFPADRGGSGAPTPTASTGASVTASAARATPPAQAAAAPAARAGRTPRPIPQRSGDGIQRYGEAVVREVLGATFLEEIEAPGFGERG
nr:DNA polymerase III subunit gamma and tau [Agromyces protaetiae]